MDFKKWPNHVLPTEDLLNFKDMYIIKVNEWKTYFSKWKPKEIRGSDIDNQTKQTLSQRL